jgi:transcriptional regulator of arginine metabolism
MDRSDMPDVLGTIAGDDTVLLVSRDPAGGDRLAERLLDLAEGRRDVGAPDEAEETGGTGERP